MSVATIYSGPAKVGLFGKATTGVEGTLLATLQPEGENGTVELTVATERVKRYSTFGGYEGTNPMDLTAKITMTPFDDWASLPALFPFAVCGYTGATPTNGLLRPGQRPHDKQAAGLAAEASTAINGCGATKLWTPSGTLWSVVRTAITKHPSLKLGPGMPFFGGIEITGLADPYLELDEAGALIDSAVHVLGATGTTGITESGASDINSSAFKGPFINGIWYGAYGTVEALGNTLAMESDGGWELTCDAKYTVAKGGGGSRSWHMEFGGVEFAVKGRIVGATATALQAACLIYKPGQAVGSTTSPGTSLVLTGPNSKVITLNNCVPMMESSGYKFGGSALTTGEVAFVTSVTYNSSTAIPDVVLQFSA